MGVVFDIVGFVWFEIKLLKFMLIWLLFMFWNWVFCLVLNFRVKYLVVVMVMLEEGVVVVRFKYVFGLFIVLFFEDMLNVSLVLYDCGVESFFLMEKMKVVLNEMLVWGEVFMVWIG